jgi:hypothetical protein
LVITIGIVDITTTTIAFGFSALSVHSSFHFIVFNGETCPAVGNTDNLASVDVAEVLGVGNGVVSTSRGVTLSIGIETEEAGSLGGAAGLVIAVWVRDTTATVAVRDTVGAIRSSSGFVVPAGRAEPPSRNSNAHILRSNTNP